ncbi:MAG: FHA domain-containing protein [Gemmataceae bacterium]
MSLFVRIYYNAVFGGLGGLIGWMLYGILGDKNPTNDYRWVQDPLAGAILGGLIAYFVVSVDAIRDRSLARFARLSTYGFLLGMLGGAFGGVVGQNLKAIFDSLFGSGETTAFSVMTDSLARGIGWTLLGVAVGMSEGIAARSLGKFSYGTIGGAIGGFIGGCLYGLFLALNAGQGEAYLSGALGLVIMGACIGALSAFVQGVFEAASVKVLRGWQEGREYPLDKIATLLGREEQADIALFRDMKVEKRHAYIRRVGKHYTLVNNDAPPENTRVNDAPVHSSVKLNDGDKIQLGNVILRFQLREAQLRQLPRRRAVVSSGSFVAAQLGQQSSTSLPSTHQQGAHHRR